MSEELTGLSSVEYASLLYDFYGSLLNDSKRDVMQRYHEDNLSLSEIAEELGMSRQGVHYTLKKAEKELRQYEEKLGLIRKYHRALEQIRRKDQIVDHWLGDPALPEELKKDIRYLCDVIDELAE